MKRILAFLSVLSLVFSLVSPALGSTPSPSTAADLSPYLGIWYADDIFDGTAIHPLGAYAGATIRLNSDLTYVFYVPSKGISSGTWTVQNNHFIPNGNANTGSFFNNTHERFFYDLSDGRRLVLFRYPSDFSAFMGTWYAVGVWDLNANESRPLGTFENAVLTIGGAYTYALTGPAMSPAVGSWSVLAGKLYFDGDERIVTQLSNGLLFSSLNDELYLIFSRTPPSSPTAAPTASPTSSPAPVLPGDINSDGAVDGRDALRLAKYLAGQSVSVDLSAADLNGDGALDGRDLLRLSKFLAGN